MNALAKSALTVLVAAGLPAYSGAQQIVALLAQHAPK